MMIHSSIVYVCENMKITEKVVTIQEKHLHLLIPAFSLYSKGHNTHHLVRYCIIAWVWNHKLGQVEPRI